MFCFAEGSEGMVTTVSKVAPVQRHVTRKDKPINSGLTLGFMTNSFSLSVN